MCIYGTFKIRLHCIVVLFLNHVSLVERFLNSPRITKRHSDSNEMKRKEEGLRSHRDINSILHVSQWEFVGGFYEWSVVAHRHVLQGIRRVSRQGVRFPL